MSKSSIFGIRKDYTGEEIYSYGNSWLFSPIIWQVLPDKYIPRYIRTPFGYNKSIIGIGGDEVWGRTNEKVNHCDNTPDRVCWEMSKQQIFHTSDKKIIADAIIAFLEQNKDYGETDEEGVHCIKKQHIIDRFREIASDILEIDETEFPFLFLKIQALTMV